MKHEDRALAAWKTLSWYERLLFGKESFILGYMQADLDRLEAELNVIKIKRSLANKA